MISCSVCFDVWSVLFVSLCDGLQLRRRFWLRCHHLRDLLLHHLERRVILSWSAIVKSQLVCASLESDGGGCSHARLTNFVPATQNKRRRKSEARESTLFDKPIIASSRPQFLSSKVLSLRIINKSQTPPCPGPSAVESVRYFRFFLLLMISLSHSLLLL